MRFRFKAFAWHLARECERVDADARSSVSRLVPLAGMVSGGHADRARDHGRRRRRPGTATDLHRCGPRQAAPGAGPGRGSNLARAIGGFWLWRHDPLARPAALLCVLRELPLGRSSPGYRAGLSRRERAEFAHWRLIGTACRAGYGRRCRTIPRKPTISSNRPSKEGSTSRLGPPTTGLGRAAPRSCAVSSSGWTTSSSSR